MQSIKSFIEDFSVVFNRLRLFLLVIINVISSQGIYGQCTDVVNPSSGPQTFNGVTVTEVSRSGAVSNGSQGGLGYGRYYCDKTSTPSTGLLVFGAANGGYSYTFQFSKPVNNVVFNILRVHNGEVHTVSTNAGSVSLISECNGLQFSGSSIISTGTVIITGATMTSNAPNISIFNGGLGALAKIRISSTQPFTRLTFSGNGVMNPDGIGYNGSAINLCSGSLVPAIVPPVISRITPPTQTRCFNTAAQTITVAATGVTSYQWRVNTVNSQTGSTSIPGATSASYTPPATSPVGTLYYYAVATNPAGSTTSPIARVITQSCITTCYKPGAIATAGNPALATKIGISSLTRTGAQNDDNWPAIREGGWLVLEAKTKGFVPNRLAFDSSGNPVGIAPANFIEGMLVYDTTNKCLKMYTSKDGATTLGWYCIATQTCPD